MMLTLNNTTEAPRGAQGVPHMVKKTKSYPARPRKVAPSHPGEGIADILDDIGMSLREAARRMRVTPMALSNVLKGKSAISPEMAVRVGKFMGNGKTLADAAAFWMRSQAEYDLWHALVKLKGEIDKIEPAPKEPVEGLDE